MIFRKFLALVIVASFALSSCNNKQTAQEKDRIDKMTFEYPLLSFGDVTFAVNVHEQEIILISSTQVDDPRIMSIVHYLNGIYGEAREDETDNYWWNTDGHNKGLGSTIRLRPLHSEDGGTVLTVTL